MGARVGSHGKAIYVKDGVTLGICLGYGGYCEHNISVQSVRSAIEILNNSMKGKGIKSTMKFRSALKKVPDAFRRDLIHPDMPYFRKSLTIRNDEIRGKFNTFQTHDGRYELMVIGEGSEVSYLRKKFSHKRIFTESDLFFMTDYQFSISSLDTVNASPEGMVTSWSCDMFTCDRYSFSQFLILVAEEYADMVLNPLEHSLTSGNLLVQCESPIRNNFDFRTLGIDFIFFDNVKRLQGSI